MKVLPDATAIAEAVHAARDTQLTQLLNARVGYLGADEGDLLRVVVVEPDDTLQMVDTALGSLLLANPYAAKTFGDPDFVPPFETLEEYAGFYEMFFIVGDSGTALIVPKEVGIDQQLLALCARHAVPAPELSS